ncbi:MAG: hypothetical protein QGH33_05050 [Pirellulaceae bacterium]|jgi:hypothetical protein|nr:hypothetical protein [Pirellulaceae bacterium]HJN66604.1 hypothetical protein [Pirellulales bacterium]|tara:strand:- start:1283 stop:2251 length:969 start_codon:yes stop_codon:yes gene_type:complete
MTGKVGYKFLVQAGSSLKLTDAIEIDNEPTADDVTAFLAANSSTLESCRQALRHDLCVPLVYNESYTSEFVLCDVARSFALAAKSAHRRGETALAIDYGLDILALSTGMRRGGIILDALAAMTAEGIGINSLRSMRTDVNGKESAILANRVLELSSRRESIDDIFERNQQWEAAVDLPNDGPVDIDCLDTKDLDEDTASLVKEMIRSIAELPEYEFDQLHRHLDNRGEALLGLLCIELAIQAYRAGNGTPPPQLHELSPQFIRDVPRDPFSMTDFVYKIADGYTLVYSSGPSGVDHGGVFGSWPDVECGDADLCLDVYDYGW